MCFEKKCPWTIWKALGRKSRQRNSQRKKLVELKWRCGYCLKTLPSEAYVLNNKPEASESIEEYVLKQGSARCCKKCLRGETKEDTEQDVVRADTYKCKECKRQRPSKCYDKRKVGVYKDIGELQELVCYDCVDVSDFAGLTIFIVYI